MMLRTSLSALTVLAVFADPALAQGAKPKAAESAKARPNSPLSGFGSGSKDPYKIDANRLEVKQEQNSATYSGDVVVIQGKMTMRCVNKLVIFFEKSSSEQTKQSLKGGAATPAAAKSAGDPGASGLKRLECHGPVTINQEKQSATANLLVYENDIVTLTGNVVITDGDNVQAGNKMTYNTKSGVAAVEGGRVRGIFTPGQAPGGAEASAPKTR
ncbi:MAG: hypothetical protein LCH61_04640 [Proteobacteria bacterium]|nr:hypothetical protein [Pseudomonadota bacterium]